MSQRSFSAVKASSRGQVFANLTIGRVSSAVELISLLSSASTWSCKKGATTTPQAPFKPQVQIQLLGKHLQLPKLFGKIGSGNTHRNLTAWQPSPFFLLSSWHVQHKGPELDTSGTRLAVSGGQKIYTPVR